MGIDPNLIQLSHPVRRVPKRPITLEELVNALKKALEVKKKKEAKKERIKRVARIELPEEDITQRMEKILNEIENIVKKGKKEKINFKEIVKEWKRHRIIERYVCIRNYQKKKKY